MVKDGLSGPERTLVGGLMGAVLGPVGMILGALIGGAIPHGERLLTSRCLKCGDVGHVTAITPQQIGFQCEKCGSFWKSKNKENLEPAPAREPSASAQLPVKPKERTNGAVFQRPIARISGPDALAAFEDLARDEETKAIFLARLRHSWSIGADVAQAALDDAIRRGLLFEDGNGMVRKRQS
jgi:hypothetical protein